MHAISLSAARVPLCPICDLPVSLDTAKTDEDGNAIHEDCYLMKLGLTPTTRGVDISNKKLTSNPEHKRFLGH